MSDPKWPDEMAVRMCRIPEHSFKANPGQIGFEQVWVQKDNANTKHVQRFCQRWATTRLGLDLHGF